MRSEPGGGIGAVKFPDLPPFRLRAETDRKLVFPGTPTPGCFCQRVRSRNKTKEMRGIVN